MHMPIIQRYDTERTYNEITGDIDKRTDMVLCGCDEDTAFEPFTVVYQRSRGLITDAMGGGFLINNTLATVSGYMWKIDILNNDRVNVKMAHKCETPQEENFIRERFFNEERVGKYRGVIRKYDTMKIKSILEQNVERLQLAFCYASHIDAMGGEVIYRNGLGYLKSLDTDKELRIGREQFTMSGELWLVLIMHDLSVEHFNVTNKYRVTPEEFEAEKKKDLNRFVEEKTILWAKKIFNLKPHLFPQTGIINSINIECTVA